jgi:hypothetical protein
MVFGSQGAGVRANIDDFRQQVPRLAEQATPAEQFSIWAMRLWWGAFPELETAWPDLVRGFRICAVTSALEAFHRFCSIALSAAGCGAGMACLYCPRITPLEDKLLEALAAATASECGGTETILRQIMPASAARMAAPHAARFARAVAQGGLRWPRAPAAHESRLAAFDPPAANEFSERLH